MWAISLLFPSQKKERKKRNVDPKKYKETVIYEIRSKAYKDIFYIGHTINPKTRFDQHKREAEDEKNTGLKSRYMRLIGPENFTFKILLTFSCNCRADAEVVEMRYIKRLKPPMNTEFVTPKQQEINERKYAEFSQKVEFTSLYKFAKGMLQALNLID